MVISVTTFSLYSLRHVFSSMKVGDRVNFRLGGLTGQIIDNYYHNKTTGLRQNGWVDEIFCGLYEDRYDVRLPNGLVIRELREWELEAV